MYALSAADPRDGELQKLKTASMMKSAPKLEWGSIVLPGRGGGCERLQFSPAEMWDKTDNDVRALAMAIINMYTATERRCADTSSAKKDTAPKIEQPRKDLMPFIYNIIKSFKR